MTRTLHTLRPVILSRMIGVLVMFNLQMITAQNDLFISEYVESNSTKCIEIFNPTNEPITLTNTYRITMGFNGDAPSTKSNLMGTIGPKSTHVVCTSTSSYNGQQSMGATGHNGNDAVILERNMVPIDIIGNIGCDPGTEWTSGGLSTHNVTLVRTGCITQGVSSDPSDIGCPFPTLGSEWVAFSSTDLTHLGTHGYLYGGLSTESTAPSDCGSSDGTLTILADGNGLEYSINESPFTTTPTFTGLSSGTYNVVCRVKDDPSCLLSTTAMVTDRVPPVINEIDPSDPTDCGVNNGKIDIAATGVSLEYSINNGVFFQTSSSFSDLAAGAYNIVVRLSGTADCLTTGATTLVAPSEPVITSIIPTPATDCNLADGQITINTSPATLQYSIDNGINWSNNRLFTGLSPGDYEVAVRRTGSPSCRDYGNVTITAPQPPALSLIETKDADCKGTSTGSILVSASGGSGNYHFNWSDPVSIGNENNPSNLPAGIYSVTVTDTDSPGCQTILTNIKIGEPQMDPPPVVLDILPALCQLDAPFPLPANSNGITGSWSGNGVLGGNLFNPMGLEDLITLTFLPTAGQCAGSNTTQIEVIAPKSPVLDLFTAVCSLDPEIDLDPTQNGIVGNWSGPGVSNNRLDPQGESGEIVLTFTPSTGQCAAINQTSIEITPPHSPQLQFIADRCEDASTVILRENQEGVTGTWSGPGVRNNRFAPDGLSGSVSLLFNVDAGQCAVDAVRMVEVFALTVTQLTPFTDVCEESAPIALPAIQGSMMGNWKGPGVTDNHFDPSGLTGSVQLIFTPLPDQCGIEATQTMSLSSAPLIDFQPIGPRCQGESNGKIIASISGGQGPFQYDWDFDGSGDFDDGKDLENISAGKYTLVVKDQKSCISSATIDLDDARSLEIRLTSHPESSLNAQDGSIEVFPKGGKAPYHFQWSNGAMTSRIDHLRPGTYSVTVTDQQGCSTWDQAIVNAGECIFTAGLQKTDISCYGLDDGILEVVSENAILPLTFSWSHDASLNQFEAHDLATGMYQVTVVDAAGCLAVAQAEIEQPDTLITLLSIQSESAPGANDAEILSVTTGGTGSYNYLWSNGSTDEYLDNLSPGLYSVTITDDNECENTSQVMVNGPLCDFDLLLHPNHGTCAGSPDGSIESTLINGQAPYSYNWSHDMSLQSSIAIALAAGLYSLTITDANGCTATRSTSIESPLPLDIDNEIQHLSSQNSGDGVITVQVSGGTVPYRYEWSTGHQSAHIEGLAAGIYFLTISDANGCQNIDSFVVDEIVCILEAVIETDPISCAGRDDGKARINIIDGQDPYKVVWDHDTSLHLLSAKNLSSGSYQVFIEDALGCKTQKIFTIGESDSLRITFQASNETVPGARDGYIAATALGGTLPYRYEWSTGHESPQIEGLGAGVYFLTINDGNGCQNIDSFVLKKTVCILEAFIETDSITCSRRDDGRVRIDIINGQPPFKVLWEHDTSLHLLSAENLSSGLYQVTIEDNFGCKTEIDFAIDEPEPLRIEFQALNETVPGAKDGYIDANALGGTLPYRYEWSTGHERHDIEGLGAGAYFLTISDANGCQNIDSLVLEETVCNLEAVIETDSISCAGREDGSARINIINGQPPFKVLWEHDTSLHLLSAENLSSGQYQVSIEDALGCKTEIIFTIAEPESLRIAFQARNETVLGAKDGYIAVTALGGTPPYYFSWNTGQRADSIGDLKPGTYIITLEDSHGCQDVRSTIINPGNCGLQSNVGTRPVVCYGEANGIARLDITTPAYPIITKWSHDTTLQSNVADMLPAGHYSVTITDETLCSHIWPFTVTQPDSLSIDYDISHQSVPGSADAAIQLTVFGGTPDYQIQWSNGLEGDFIQNLMPGTYYLTVEDKNGCILDDSIVVFSAEVCQLTIEANVKHSGCNQDNGSIDIQTFNDRGRLRHDWSIPGQGSISSVENLAPGTYWVEVSDDYCKVRDTFSVQVNEIRSVSYNLKQSLCDKGETELEIGSVTGGQGPYQYFLDSQLFDQTGKPNLEPGIHLLMIQDNQGCEYEEAFSVSPADFITVMSDTVLKRGEQLSLNASIAGYNDQLVYHWRSRQGVLCEQCKEVEINPVESGIYLFEVIDADGCNFSAQVRVTVSEQDLIYIPNAFTPNDDGNNDGFQIYDGLQLVEEILLLEIFDRRGVKVFSANNFKSNEEVKDFSGIMSEAIAPQIYMYIMKVRFRQGYDQVIKGDFVILR